jgi:hypothetical protein
MTLDEVRNGAGPMNPAVEPMDRIGSRPSRVVGEQGPERYTTASFAIVDVGQPGQRRPNLQAQTVVLERSATRQSPVVTS